MDKLQTIRERNAEELQYRAGLRSPAVIRASAEVPPRTLSRPRPWQIYYLFESRYWTMPDADPKHVYHWDIRPEISPRTQEVVDADYVVLRSRVPLGPSRTQTLDCIQLLGEEVLPTLK